MSERGRYRRDEPSAHHSHTLAWAAGGAVLGGAVGYTFAGGILTSDRPTVSQRITGTLAGAGVIGGILGGSAYLGERGVNPLLVGAGVGGASLLLSGSEGNSVSQQAPDALTLGGITALAAYSNRR